MLRSVITVLAILCTIEVFAYKPLYVVNGEVVESIEHIPHENIERIDNLPADEETIATWGLGASEGVILVTLRFDTEARFSHDEYKTSPTISPLPFAGMIPCLQSESLSVLWLTPLAKPLSTR